MNLAPAPSYVPTSKITAVAAAGALVTVAVWISALLHFDIPADVAAGLVTLIAVAAGWFKTERRPV